MAKVTERCFEATGHTCFICDFSPPRAGDPALLEEGLAPAAGLDVDFISVAYNPGRAVRVNSAMLAAAIRQRVGKEVVFTLATRDMNKLALQSQLLGAQLLGLQNVIVVQGDPFSERDLAQVKAVADLTPSQLIASIAKMNQGEDYRSSQLRAPTDFCIGATVDLGRGIQREARLAHRKARAGAHFCVTQPIFDAGDAARFRDAYATVASKSLQPPLPHPLAPSPSRMERGLGVRLANGLGGIPVFFGLQVLEPEGILFSSVPQHFRDELTRGRSGVDLAVELYRRFQESGIHNIYLVPPIRRGGARNYAAAQEVLANVPRL